MPGPSTTTTNHFAHPDYVVVRLLGTGGQAQVFLARHRTLQRQVAIKVLRDPGDESMARRMLQEARLIANLRHPNLVQVFDAGQSDDGRPYIIMEYIDGQPLHRWQPDQTLSIQDALELVWQVASGLAPAHAAGIVHRDVKPPNILVEDRAGQTGERFCAKLLDFGVARPHNSDETAVGVVIGTIGFMAPEVYDGKPQPASDLFSLGVILHWLLSGQKGLRATAIRSRLLENPSPDEAWRQHPDLVSLVQDMVDDDPSERPPQAASLVERLDALRPWSRFDEPAPPTTHTVISAPHRTRSTSLPVALFSGIFIVLLGSAGLFAWLRHQESQPAPQQLTAPIPPAAVETNDSRAARDATPPPTTAPPAVSPSAAAASAPPPPAAPSAPAAPASTAPPPESTAPPSTGAAAPPSPTPPVEPPSGAAAPPDGSAGAQETSTAPSTPPPPVPESTPPSASIPTGRFAGSVQGRPVTVELSGTARALRATLDLQVGARSERHSLVGSASQTGDAWSFAVSEPGGKWSVTGTVRNNQMSGSISIKGRQRGSFDAQRTP